MLVKIGIKFECHYQSADRGRISGDNQRSTGVNKWINTCIPLVITDKHIYSSAADKVITLQPNLNIEHHKEYPISCKNRHIIINIEQDILETVSIEKKASLVNKENILSKQKVKL